CSQRPGDSMVRERPIHLRADYRGLQSIAAVTACLQGPSFASRSNQAPQRPTLSPPVLLVALSDHRELAVSSKYAIENKICPQPDLLLEAEVRENFASELKFCG